jgi:N-acyl-D-amino-acid deacylase
MFSRVGRTGFVLVVSNVLAMGAHAQYPSAGYRPNPLTGGNAPQTAYNPLTGAGAPKQVNPFTGSAARSQPAVNPYNGRPMQAPTGYNALTGKLQALGAAPMPTAPVVYQWPRGKFPVTGQAGPGMDEFDPLVQTMMGRHGIPGAALVVAKDGKLVYAKGFGWADLTAATPVHPLTVFGIASLSKPLTALAILWLIEHGFLRLDDCAFDILRNIQPLPGARVDPRLKTVTVRQLLNHTGGWDRQKSGDPVNWEPQIAAALGVAGQVTPSQFISFMMGTPLDFAPGTRIEYSNVGYIILGRIIEKVSGQPYEDFVRKHVLVPAGVTSPFISRGVRSYGATEARRYLAGTSVLLPPMDMPMVQGAGGWCASAVDLVRVLTALDGSRGKALLSPATMNLMLAPPPPPLKVKADGTFNALGWPAARMGPQGFGYAHDGNFHGMRTFMKRSIRGVNFALLFNVSTQPDPVDAQMITHAVQETRTTIEAMERFPDIDLFGQFR